MNETFKKWYFCWESWKCSTLINIECFSSLWRICYMCMSMWSWIWLNGGKRTVLISWVTQRSLVRRSTMWSQIIIIVAHIYHKWKFTYKNNKASFDLMMGCWFMENIVIKDQAVKKKFFLMSVLFWTNELLTFSARCPMSTNFTGFGSWMGTSDDQSSFLILQGKRITPRVWVVYVRSYK